MNNGTRVDAKVSRVVDGDTLRVFLPGAEEDESLRILALDTEESRAGSGKPKTPWGVEAKKRAEAFFTKGDTVTLEFPGNEPLAVCMQKYRGNFGRLLVFVHNNGVDFQETMIREGYSPYFTKYGNAQLEHLHLRYTEAERHAQQQGGGIWDQITVNGSEIRNYAALGTWWSLRAQIIDQYRALKSAHSDLLNTRLDYQEIVQKAQIGEEVVIFTEIRDLKRIAIRHTLASIGSIQQPFSLFIPDSDGDIGQNIIELLVNRYIPGEETHPRRGYAYIKGELSLFRDKPQMKITSPFQITDNYPSCK
ncbi:thermonuclease family protein [Parasalinivibrio latis]|uniref:thermonuclease family protein n=1 Tax=Parasalinivibrio latis TaxID=2952610 RepID=UPI0030E53580